MPAHLRASRCKHVTLLSDHQRATERAGQGARPFPLGDRLPAPGGASRRSCRTRSSKESATWPGSLSMASGGWRGRSLASRAPWRVRLARCRPRSGAGTRTGRPASREQGARAPRTWPQEPRAVRGEALAHRRIAEQVGQTVFAPPRWPRSSQPSVAIVRSCSPSSARAVCSQLCPGLGRPASTNI